MSKVSNDLAVLQGDTFTLNVKVQNTDASDTNLTSKSLTFSYKIGTTLTTKSTSTVGSGFVVVTAVEGTALLTLTAVETTALPPGNYDYSIKLIDGTVVTTLVKGSLVVKKGVV
jgi:hypothetical protein